MAGAPWREKLLVSVSWEDYRYEGLRKWLLELGDNLREVVGWAGTREACLPGLVDWLLILSYPFDGPVVLTFKPEPHA